MNTTSTKHLRQTAETFWQSQQYAAAVSAFQRLLASPAATADDWFNFGVLLRQAGRPAEALKAFEKALCEGVDHPEEAHLNRSAILVNELRDAEAAEAELLRALEYAPGYLHAQLNLATLCEDRGDRETARQLYESVLLLAPENSIALSRLAGLSDTRDPSDALIRQLEAALDRSNLTGLERAELGYATAQLLDRCGKFERAFDCLEAANRANGASWTGPPFSEQALQARVSGTINAFGSAQTTESDAVPVEPVPVLITGMYRSGSTLLEQILASHSSVAAGGEIEFLPRIARRVGSDPFRLASLDAGTRTAVRTAYLQHMSDISGGKPVVTDKQPLNIWQCGFAAQIIPGIRIIHTVRDPMDTLVSVLFQHLHPSHTYAMDPESCAVQLIAERTLMAHWKRVIPASVHTVRYEDLIADQTSETQKILDFLDLPFEANCLEFQKSDSIVRTASVWQVREALHARSIGRWKNYASRLDRARTRLETAGLL